MKAQNQPFRFLIGVFFFLAAAVACSTVPELKVHYRLPPKSEVLRGRKVFLAFKDMRRNKDILGNSAQQEFKQFSGNISLSLARENEAGFKMGAYDIPSLFLEVFKRRLGNLGIDVVQEKKRGQLEMTIGLKDFMLELIGRKWVAKMGYEAMLSKDGRVLAKQTIDGQAERPKLLGRGQADKVMGEVFTDTVNRLDVSKLFHRADR